MAEIISSETLLFLMYDQVAPLALVLKLSTRLIYLHCHIASDCQIGIISWYWVGSSYCLCWGSQPNWAGLCVTTIILTITMITTITITILMIIAMIKMTMQQQIAFVKPLEVYWGNIIFTDIWNLEQMVHSNEIVVQIFLNPKWLMVPMQVLF